MVKYILLEDHMFVRRMGLVLTAGALILALGTPAAEAAESSTHGITVQATGIVKVTPDGVRLNLTATTLGATSKDALAATANTASAIRKVLAANGIAVKDISTARFTVNPEYTYSQDKSPIISGYRATQSFNIVIRQANSSGVIIDQVVAAAGDGVTIDIVTPFVLDSEKALVSARISAVKKAKAKALAYAKLLSARLGTVQYLTELNSDYSPGPIMYVGAAKGDSSTQIDLGQQNVSVSVEVRWNLR
jgi:uncharacterized protein YggE